MTTDFVPISFKAMVYKCVDKLKYQIGLAFNIS